MTNSIRFIFHTTAYTVGISILFFIVASLLQIEELSISFLRYMTIFSFSLVLSGSEFIFSVKKLHIAARWILHYCVLCIAFFAVFLTVQNSSGEYEFNGATIFAAVIIFTVIYVVASLFIVFVTKSDKTISKAKKKDQKIYQSKFNWFLPYNIFGIFNFRVVRKVAFLFILHSGTLFKIWHNVLYNDKKDEVFKKLVFFI